MKNNRKAQPALTPAPTHATAPLTPTVPEVPVVTEEARDQLFGWKLLGALAAALGLAVVIGVYHFLQSQLAGLRNDTASLGKELRRDVDRLNQNALALIKKEEVSTRFRTVWDRLKELQAGRTDIATLRERCTLLTELYKAGEQERKGMSEQVRKLRLKGRATAEKDEVARQVQQLRDRISQLENKPVGAAGCVEEADKR